jgi:hypothetical protein
LDHTIKMTWLTNVKLTDEQEEVKRVILSGKSCVVNACPGAGKTTLSLVVAKDFKKKTLILTFSSKLKDETRGKIKENNMENHCKVHSYNSAPRDHYLKDARNDEDIYIILATDMEPGDKIDYEFIVLDEIQDMTKVHYKYLVKFIKDMNINPVFLIIGDIDQSIFQFKGADGRYLTMFDQLEFNGEFIQKNLTKTFRLTNHMVSFINEAVYGYTKYTSLSPIKDCKPVSYIKCDTFGDKTLFKHLVKKIKGYDINEVYIVAPSIKSTDIHIKRLENYIAIHHREIKVYIPKSDNDYTNDKVCENKIVMTNYHKVKGSEKQLVIVFGFDESYFKFNASETDPTDRITNPMLVGITRASSELILIQDNTHEPLPFIKMSLQELSKKDYCEVTDIQSNSLRKNNRDKPREISVTKLTGHISQDNEILLCPLVNSGIFSIISGETTNIKIPSDISIGNTTEGVSHLNGVAIPAYYEYLRNNQTSILEYVKSNDKRSGLLTREILRLPDNSEDFQMKDYLRTANIRESILSGTLSNLNQIKDYSWLKNHHVKHCKSNMDKVFGDQRLEFEIPVSYIMDHNKYGTIELIGSLDVSTNEDNIYELKCTDSLTITNKLQLIVYAYMWLKQYPNDRKRFYLFNIRTSEILELNTDRDEIEQIMKILIDNKIKKPEKISDEEFIKSNKGPLKLYEINEEDIKDSLSDISDGYAFIGED